LAGIIIIVVAQNLPTRFLIIVIVQSYARNSPLLLFFTLSFIAENSSLGRVRYFFLHKKYPFTWFQQSEIIKKFAGSLYYDFLESKLYS